MAFENTVQNTVSGGMLGAKFGPKGAAIGAGAGALVGGIQDMINAIRGHSRNRQQQQQIFNQMVAAGYPITGNPPKGIKVPKGAQFANGTSPQNAAIFFDPQTGNPVISTEHPGHPYTGPANTQAIPTQRIAEINNDFYSGKGAQHRANYEQANLAPNGLSKEQWESGARVPGLALTPQSTNAVNPQGSGNGSNPSGGAAGDWWNGRQASNEQVPRFTPAQSKYQESVIGDLMKNKADFGPIRDEELRRFKEETAPYLAERYFGKNPNSFGSAYPEALGRGGAGLGSKLAAMQSQYEADREGRQMNVALQPSFDTLRRQREPGFKDTFNKDIVPNLIQAGGEIAGNYFKNKGNSDSSSDQSADQQINPVTPQRAPFEQLTPQNARTFANSDEASQLSKNLSNLSTPRSDTEASLINTLLKKKLGGGY